MASPITSLTIVYSTVYSGADQSKNPSSASLDFVWGIHHGPVNSPPKWPVTRKMFPFDDVIMTIKRGIVFIAKLPYWALYFPFSITKSTSGKVNCSISVQKMHVIRSFALVSHICVEKSERQLSFPQWHIYASQVIIYFSDNPMATSQLYEAKMC